MRKKNSSVSKFFKTKARTFLSGEGALRLFSIALMLGAGCALTFAAGEGAFEEATTTFKNYETPVKNLMNAIAACIAIVGAFTVYFKMQNGDQDVKKTIMMTIGGCVAFIALAKALPAFFGS